MDLEFPYFCRSSQQQWSWRLIFSAVAATRRWRKFYVNSHVSLSLSLSLSLSQSFSMCMNVRACCARLLFDMLTGKATNYAKKKIKDWVSFYVVLNFCEQQKYKTRYTTRSKTRWQSKRWAPVPKRLCKRYAARVVNALSAFRSYRLPRIPPTSRRPRLLHRPTSRRPRRLHRPTSRRPRLLHDLRCLLARSLCLYRFAYHLTRLMCVAGHVLASRSPVLVVVVGLGVATWARTGRSPVLVVVVGLGVATWAALASRSPVLVVVVGLGVATWAAVITFVKKIHQNAEPCKWKYMLVSSVMRCYTHLGLLYSCFIGLETISKVYECYMKL